MRELAPSLLFILNIRVKTLTNGFPTFGHYKLAFFLKKIGKIWSKAKKIILKLLNMKCFWRFSTLEKIIIMKIAIFLYLIFSGYPKKFSKDD